MNNCSVCGEGTLTQEEGDTKAAWCDLCHSLFYNGVLAPTTIVIGYCPMDKAFVLQVKCGAYTIYELMDEDLSEFFLKTCTEVTEWYLKNSKETAHHTHWRIPMSRIPVK